MAFQDQIMNSVDQRKSFDGAIENFASIRVRLPTRFNLVEKPQFGSAVIKMNR